MGFIQTSFIATADQSGAAEIGAPRAALLDSIDAVAEAAIAEIDRRLAALTPAELAEYDARMDAELEAWLATES